MDPFAPNAGPAAPDFSLTPPANNGPAPINESDLPGFILRDFTVRNGDLIPKESAVTRLLSEHRFCMDRWDDDEQRALLIGTNESLGKTIETVVKALAAQRKVEQHVGNDRWPEWRNTVFGLNDLLSRAYAQRAWQMDSYRNASANGRDQSAIESLKQQLSTDCVTVAYREIITTRATAEDPQPTRLRDVNVAFAIRQRLRRHATWFRSSGRMQNNGQQFAADPGF